MPRKLVGSSSNRFLLILGALVLPTGGVLLRLHPVAGPYIQNGYETIRDAVASEDASEEPFEFNLEGIGRKIDSLVKKLVNPEKVDPIAAVRHEIDPLDKALQEPQPEPVAAPSSNPVPVQVEATPPAMDRPPVLMTKTSVSTHFGLPIARFTQESWILQNTGVIENIPRDKIISEHILEEAFEPIELRTLVTELRKEFGGDFRVRSERPYVWVSRNGVSQFWDERFRSLHASMRQFCRVRGLDIRAIEFPLVAIILGSEQEFYQYCRTHKINVPDNCLGIYSQMTNRIILYEDAAKLTKQDTIDTICHEAAHQLAFNLGLQQRCADCPLWLSEGFATLFEAPAYSQPNSIGKSPWPTYRRDTWTKLQEDPYRVSTTLDSLVRSDNMFKQDPDAAYAVAWALTHYLATNYPKQFNTYLHQTSQLPPFLDFDSNDRWEHFRTIFGSDVSKLSIALRKHVASL